MNGHKIDGKQLSLSVLEKKTSREEQPDNFVNLYVGQLPKDFTNEEFQDLFQQFGEITSFKIDETKNCGYVKFKTHESAVQAIQELNLKKEINGKMIVVSKHIPQAVN